MQKFDSFSAEFRRIWLVPALTASLVVTLDQISKYWIWNTMGPVEGTSVALVGEWLRFTLVRNTGVAFGMFQNYPEFFTVTSILISLGALYFYRHHLPNRLPLVQLCIGLVLGGAVGNIIDRLRFGFVIDFIHVTWFPGIFNIADSAITVSVLTLAAYLLFTGEPDQPTPPEATETPHEEIPNREAWPQQAERPDVKHET